MVQPLNILVEFSTDISVLQSEPGAASMRVNLEQPENISVVLANSSVVILAHELKSRLVREEQFLNIIGMLQRLELILNTSGHVIEVKFVQSQKRPPKVSQLETSQLLKSTLVKLVQLPNT